MDDSENVVLRPHDVCEKALPRFSLPTYLYSLRPFSPSPLFKSVSAIAISDILPTCPLIFTEGNKTRRYHRDSAGRRLLCLSRSPILISVRSPYGLPVSYWYYLHPVSHRFQVIADYWSTICTSDKGVPLFNTLVRGESFNSGVRTMKFGLKKLETSLCGAKRISISWTV